MALSPPVTGALARLRGAQAQLTPALGRLAQTILNAPHEVIYQSITELAESAQVGEASVMRLCRDLGFRGFQEFKLVLAADVARTPETAPEGILQRVTEAALRALSDTSALLAADPARTLEPALAQLEATRTLLICGAGASGISAQDYGYKFLRLGYSVTVPSDPHLAAMSVATLPAGALLIALTRSGSTIDTVRTLELARARGLASLLVTERAKSPAVAAADVVIYTASGESPLTGGSITSKIGQLLVLDALFSELAERLPGARAAVAATAHAVADRNI